MNRQLFVLVAAILACHVFYVESQSEYFGVAYSPYVKGVGTPWNSYTVQEIKQMLYIVIRNHKSIATYSMGVTKKNMNKPWEEADADCLVSYAASLINREEHTQVLSMAQGIKQHEDTRVQAREIKNAFEASASANEEFPGTVWGLIFTTDYVYTDANGQKVLKMIQDYKGKAHGMGLRVGTRINNCKNIYNGGDQGEIIKEIVAASDFIMCNQHPNSNSVDIAFKRIIDEFNSYSEVMKKINPNIEVMIGETGWASDGYTENKLRNTVENQKKFWGKMKLWSVQHKVKVHMFEAFDEPWKFRATGHTGEKKFGWWYKGDGNYFFEKSTGYKF